MHDGKLYLKYNHAQRRDADEILYEFSHHFKWRYDGSDQLLDIGSGPGDVNDSIDVTDKCND